MESSDKDNLKRFVHARFNRFFGEVLSTAELLSKNDFQYTTIRTKTLRQGNNALREIFAEIDGYDVKAGPNKVTRIETYEVEGEGNA